VREEGASGGGWGRKGGGRSERGRARLGGGGGSERGRAGQWGGEENSRKVL
jgi:hypothetical protein